MNKNAIILLFKQIQKTLHKKLSSLGTDAYLRKKLCYCLIKIPDQEIEIIDKAHKHWYQTPRCKDFRMKDVMLVMLEDDVSLELKHYSPHLRASYFNSTKKYKSIYAKPSKSKDALHRTYHRSNNLSSFNSLHTPGNSILLQSQNGTSQYTSIRMYKIYEICQRCISKHHKYADKPEKGPKCSEVKEIGTEPGMLSFNDQPLKEQLRKPFNMYQINELHSKIKDDYKKDKNNLNCGSGILSSKTRSVLKACRNFNRNVHTAAAVDTSNDSDLSHGTSIKLIKEMLKGSDFSQVDNLLSDLKLDEQLSNMQMNRNYSAYENNAESRLKAFSDLQCSQMLSKVIARNRYDMIANYYKEKPMPFATTSRLWSQYIESSNFLKTYNTCFHMNKTTFNEGEKHFDKKAVQSSHFDLRNLLNGILESFKKEKPMPFATTSRLWSQYIESSNFLKAYNACIQLNKTTFNEGEKHIDRKAVQSSHFYLRNLLNGMLEYFKKIISFYQVIENSLLETGNKAKRFLRIKKPVYKYKIKPKIYSSHKTEPSNPLKKAEPKCLVDRIVKFNKKTRTNLKIIPQNIQEESNIVVNKDFYSQYKRKENVYDIETPNILLRFCCVLKTMIDGVNELTNISKKVAPTITEHIKHINLDNTTLNNESTQLVNMVNSSFPLKLSSLQNRTEYKLFSLKTNSGSDNTSSKATYLDVKLKPFGECISFSDIHIDDMKVSVCDNNASSLPNYGRDNTLKTKSALNETGYTQFPIPKYDKSVLINLKLRIPFSTMDVEKEICKNENSVRN